MKIKTKILPLTMPATIYFATIYHQIKKKLFPIVTVLATQTSSTLSPQHYLALVLSKNSLNTSHLRLHSFRILEMPC